MLGLENVAMPELADCVRVPDRVPLEGFVPIASVMLALDEVTVFPPASWTETCTEGEIVAPPVAPVGCTENASLDALPTVILKLELVAELNPVAEAVSV